MRDGCLRPKDRCRQDCLLLCKINPVMYLHQLLFLAQNFICSNFHLMTFILERTLLVLLLCFHPMKPDESSINSNFRESIKRVLGGDILMLTDWKLITDSKRLTRKHFSVKRRFSKKARNHSLLPKKNQKIESWLDCS